MRRTGSCLPTIVHSLVTHPFDYYHLMEDLFWQLHYAYKPKCFVCDEMGDMESMSSVFITEATEVSMCKPCVKEHAHSVVSDGVRILTIKQ